MKLKKYLLEKKKKESLTDEQKEFLEKKASKILKIYRANPGKYLYRGIGDYSGEIFKEMKGYVANRKPKHTDKKIHKVLNDKFKEKFGWKVRNGISTANKFTLTLNYGEAYVFFPPNNYKFAWSEKITDLYADFPLASGIPAGIAGHRKEEAEFLKKKQRSFTIIVNKYTDKDLEKALNSTEREILFKASKYWLVKMEAAEDWLGEYKF